MRSWPIFIARQSSTSSGNFISRITNAALRACALPFPTLFSRFPITFAKSCVPTAGRSFSVYVEPLAGGKTIFKTFGDQYALVVRPSSDPPMDDIRHAFLHFLLDPIAIRYRVQAAKASPLLEYAARAPLLPVDLRDDFSAFFDECLVRAVELRLRRLSPVELASAIDQAEEQRIRSRSSHLRGAFRI